MLTVKVIAHTSYTSVIYKGIDNKVKIYCVTHRATFWQTPYKHLKGQGCPKCGVKKCHEPNTIWNKETITQEAKKYNSRSDFENGSGGAYNAALKLKIKGKMKNKILLAFLVTAIGCTPMAKRTNSIEGGWVSKPLNKRTFYISYQGSYLTSNTTAEQLALDQAHTTCLKAGNSGEFKIVNGSTTSSHLQVGAFMASVSLDKPTASYIIECESAQRLNNLVNYKFNTPRSVVVYPDSNAGTVNRQRFNEAWEKYLKNNSKE